MFDIHFDTVKKLKDKHRDDSDRDLLHHLLIHVHSILETQNFIIEKLLKMAGELDALKQQVADSITVEESAVVLLGGLKEQLDAAIAAGDPAALTALSDQLGAEKDKLAAAVTANTPAAPTV